MIHEQLDRPVLALILLRATEEFDQLSEGPFVVGVLRMRALRLGDEVGHALFTLDRPVHIVQLGLMFADRNEFSLALDRFEHALSHEPHNLDYLANVALALQEMGLVDRATAGWRTLCQVAQATSQASNLPST